ncbi:SUKH-4 family immunity protein [Nocardia sp. NPDC056000]|uniref:SUKH-4 family immunity protein n=1 Tax=Nocardia sp. NPDC056000 TaxID=3345674 RepID=UPI0035E2BE13
MVFTCFLDGNEYDLYERVNLELVNSTVRSFVEFLHRFSVFIDADIGIEGRMDRATALRAELMEIDEAAFISPQSWWSMAMAELGAIQSR